MSAKSDLKKLRAQIVGLNTKQAELSQAIARVNQPNPEAAAASAAVSLQHNVVTELRVKIALGQAKQGQLDEALKRLGELISKTDAYAVANDGIAEAEAVLRADQQEISNQVRELQAQVPALEYAILREFAEKAIDEYDTATRVTMQKWDAAAAAMRALESHTSPQDGRPALWPMGRSMRLELPHTTAHRTYPGVNFNGVLIHDPDMRAVNARAAETRALLLGDDE